MRETRGEVGLSGVLGATLPLGGTSRAEARLWLLDAGPTPGGYWDLHRRGYSFLSEAGIEVEERGGEEARVERGAEVGISGVRVATGLELGLLGRWTDLRGVSLALPSFVLEGGLPSHEGTLAFDPGARGEVGVVRAEMAWSPDRRLEIRGHYRWAGTLSGDDAFRSSRAAIPRHRWVQRVTWRPLPDLWMALRADARSDARWEAYRAMGRELVPGGTRLGPSAGKDLWAGRARVQGRLGDLLDEEIALHPLGAAPGLTLAVEGAVRIGR